MKKTLLNYFLSTFSVVLIFSVGCSKGGNNLDPTVPGSMEPGFTDPARFSQITSHALLGLWDFIYDFETRNFDIVPLREAGFHLNIGPAYNFPGNLTVEIINNTLLTDGGLDIDITLRHPLPDSIFTGFDMRGIFFGDGPDTLASKDNPDLLWLAPTGFSLGNPDGFTRWWNPTEFTTPGYFGFKPGIYGSDFTPPSTLSPYKYFATGLGAVDSIAPFVNQTNRGAFRSDGGPVTRRFQLRFPFDGSPGSLKLQYAFDVCWVAPTGGGDIPEPSDFPVEANCPEPFHVVADSSFSSVYYAGPGDYGGSVFVQMEVFDWNAPYAVDGIDDEIKSISVESPTLFDNVENVIVDSFPGSSPLSGIFNIEIPNVHPTGIDGQNVLISIVSQSGSYAPPVPANYPDDDLVTYVLVDIPVIGVDPTIIGFFNVSGEVVDVVTAANYVYVITSLGDLVIIDATDPSAMVLVNSLPLEGDPNSIDFQDGWVYVTDSTGNLFVIDVTPPLDTALMKTVQILGSPTSVDADGDYAYVVDTDNNLYIVDITTPWLAYVFDIVSASGPGPAEDIDVKGDHAFVCDDFEIFDISSPGSVTSLKIVDTTTLATGAAIGDGFAYVANSSNQLLVVDINPPGSANIVETYNAGSQITGVGASGDYVFFTLANNLFMVAFFEAELQELHILGSVTLPSLPNSVFIENNIAFVGCEGQLIAVKLYDVDSPQPDGWGIVLSNSSSNNVEAIGTVADNNGNIYVTGLFTNTCDFDPGPNTVTATSSGGDDVFLSKFNGNGTLMWVRTWGSTSKDHGYDIDVDSYGNIYVAGYFSGSVDFNPGQGVETYDSVGLTDCFISKFDSNGDYQWARTWGSTYYDGCNALDVDGSNIFITGQVSDTTDFDPGPQDYILSPSGYDAYLSMYSTDGSFLWAKIWGSSAYDSGQDIKYNASSAKVYVVGEFRGTVEFDAGTGSDIKTSAGDADAYLTSYDIYGYFYEVLTWGGSDYDTAVGIDIDSNGYIYVSGGFNGTADFHPQTPVENHSSNGEGDAYVSRFNPNMVYDWVQTWGGTLNDYGTAVTVDSSGNYYVKGKFQDYVDFDPGPGTFLLTATSVDEDIFVSSFNSSGVHFWSRSWPAIHGSGQDFGICTDNQGNIYIGDASTGTIDLDPGPGFSEYVLDNDAFLVKLLPNGFWFW